MLLGLVVVTAKSYTPLPVTREVTSTLTQFPEAKFPEEPITGPRAGVFWYVIELPPNSGWQRAAPECP